MSLEGDIGSQDAAERLYAEETAGRHLTDVINVALPDLTTLLARNMIARFTTPAIDKVLPPYKGFIDQEGRWTPWYWSEHGISYNSSLVPKDKVPTAWKDLCNPFFKGSVSFDPAEDRYLSGLYAIMGEEETDKLLECIGANDPIIQRGHTQRIELMLAGDHMVQGDNYLYHGIAVKRKNPRGALRHLLFGAGDGLRRRRRDQQEHAAAARRRAVDRLDADRGEPEIRGDAAARADRAQASLSARGRQDRHLHRCAGGRLQAAAGHLEQIRRQAELGASVDAR